MEDTRRSAVLRSLGSILKWLALAGALCLLARALGKADLPRAMALITRAGPWVLLAGVPYLIAISLDSLAWRRLFATIDRRAPFPRLLGIRIRFDAIASSIPAGAVLAESFTPGWLRASLSIPVETSLAAIAARKCAVGIAQSLYLVVSFAVGFELLAARGRALPWVVLALAVTMLALFGATAATLFFGRVAARLRALLAALPIAPLRRWLAARDQSFHGTDAQLGRFARAGLRPFAAPLALFCGAWLMESAETWLLLTLLGARVSPTDVLAFEASLSLLRSLVFFAPGGIGFQDIGYMAVLGALGVPDAAAVGSAFVVLKRGKELAWACVGYALIGASQLRARAVSRDQAGTFAPAP